MKGREEEAVAAVGSALSTLTEDLVVYTSFAKGFLVLLDVWLGGLSFAIESGRGTGNFCAQPGAPSMFWIHWNT